MNKQNERVFKMSFSKVYAMLVAKAERKGRTRTEVDEVTSWLTGYEVADLERFSQSDLTYGDFFDQAPAMNANRDLITGKICGVQIEAIEHPTMKAIRQLDKLVDELAKGRPMDKILRSIIF